MRMIKVLILGTSLVGLISLDVNTAMAINHRENLIVVKSDRRSNFREDSLLASRQNRQSRYRSRANRKKPVVRENNLVCSPNNDTVRIRGSNQRVRRYTFSNCK